MLKENRPNKDGYPPIRVRRFSFRADLRQSINPGLKAVRPLLKKMGFKRKEKGKSIELSAL